MMGKHYPQRSKLFFTPGCKNKLFNAVKLGILTWQSTRVNLKWSLWFLAFSVYSCFLAKTLAVVSFSLLRASSVRLFLLKQASLWAPSAMGCVFSTCPLRIINRRYSRTQQSCLFGIKQPCSHSKSSCLSLRAICCCSAATWSRWWQNSPWWPTRPATSISTRAGENQSDCFCVVIAVSPTYLLILLACSIRFSVARGKEGIIDFVRGTELKVTKGKRGHLLVVSQQLLWYHVGSLQTVRGVLICESSDQLTVFTPQTAPRITTTWRNGG